MSAKNKFFPYPVLGNGNAVRPELTDDAVIMPDPKMTDELFVFDIELNQRNQDITKLIAQGKAEYVCEIYCATTLLQKKYTSEEPRFNIELNRKEVSGHVDFDFYVILKESITYSNIGFHEDYEGITFDLERGNILVIFPHASFNAKLVNEKMFAVGSIIRFRPSDADEISYDMDQDECVYMLLPQAMHDQYTGIIQGNGNNNEIIMSSLLYNAMVYVISNYVPDAHDDKTWADALKARIRELENKRNETLALNYKNADRITSLLLKNPYERLFNYLVSRNENEDGTSTNI